MELKEHNQRVKDLAARLPESPPRIRLTAYAIGYAANKQTRVVEGFKRDAILLMARRRGQYISAAGFKRGLSDLESMGVIKRIAHKGKDGKQRANDYIIDLDWHGERTSVREPPVSQLSGVELRAIAAALVPEPETAPELRTDEDPWSGAATVAAGRTEPQEMPKTYEEYLKRLGIA